VFRSQFPLQTIINPALVNDMINSLVTLADESGNHYLERWELLNAYSGCMLGNPAVVVLADAYMKGIRDYDINKAYQYAVNTNEKFGNGALGYTTDVSIAKTLEYAFDDWCLSQMAAALGKKKMPKNMKHVVKIIKISGTLHITGFVHAKRMAVGNLGPKKAGWPTGMARLKPILISKAGLCRMMWMAWRN
jgi:putative alpha-1,2-mannosidase